MSLHRHRPPPSLGLGPDGRLFLLAYNLHLYGSFGILRSICIRDWELAFQPTAAALAGTTTGGGAGSAREANGSLPVGRFADSATSTIQVFRSIGQLEVGLLAASLALGILAQLCLTLRLDESLGLRARLSVLAIVLAGAQTCLNVAALVNFGLTRNVSGIDVSQGYLSVIYGSVFTLLGAILLAVEGHRSGFSNADIGPTRKKFMTASSMAILVVAFGGMCFHFIEGISYDESFPFALTSLVAVGYGNVVVRSTGGRIVLFGYFFLGACVITVFLLCWHQNLAERMKDAARRMVVARVRRRQQLMRCLRQRYEELNVPAHLVPQPPERFRSRAQILTRRCMIGLGLIEPTEFEQALEEMRTALRAARRRDDKAAACAVPTGSAAAAVANTSADPEAAQPTPVSSGRMRAALARIRAAFWPPSDLYSADAAGPSGPPRLAFDAAPDNPDSVDTWMTSGTDASRMPLPDFVDIDAVVDGRPSTAVASAAPGGRGSLAVEVEDATGSTDEDGGGGGDDDDDNVNRVGRWPADPVGDKGVDGGGGAGAVVGGGGGLMEVEDDVGESDGSDTETPPDAEEVVGLERWIEEHLEASSDRRRTRKLLLFLVIL
ncbi:hypothetical protein HK405_012840 [Cladochytrium tenue]|nr:hypothetical protein HK405_012840 [Cladochytrium tenue]